MGLPSSIWLRWERFLAIGWRQIFGFLVASTFLVAVITGGIGWYVGQAQERAKVREKLKIDVITDYFSSKTAASPQDTVANLL